MQLYNTLTRRVEAFKPQNPEEVTLYTCGPTVYDHVHLGNLRTYIFEDTLRRALWLSNFKLKHVMNITDVDDKTIRRSRQQYPNEDPHEALKKLASLYEKIFFEDALKVGIDLSNSQIARASQHIGDMQELIKKIPNKYISEDGVYFNIEEYPEYGVFVKLDRSHAHHRIQNDEYDKDHVADFALWKAKKEGEPSWDFEIEGQNVPGRPGWHIECSAMSTKYLGQPFDIHTGGIDLMFPHHENEVAQSRAAAGKDLAKFFLHAQHLLVDGRKMSKSFNNFYTLEDVIKKGFDPLAFRLLVLQAHYRSQMNFTWESLEAAQQNLNSLNAWADLAHQPGKLSPAFTDQSASFLKQLSSSFENDLNTPQALAAVNQAVEQFTPTSEMLDKLDKLLGLRTAGRADISDGQKAMIKERETFRQSQNWSKADELRQKLMEQGIEINDTQNGPIWSRTR